MKVYGIDTLRDFLTITTHEDGGETFTTRPWKAEFTAPTFECACDAADEVAREGGLAHVWFNGGIVYRAGDFSKIETEA